ncbi:ATP-binding protein [Metapseudomonas furukawaii]|jgi:two-component system sensor histidine kinase PhoQ|uniref:histidine kinase n=1 Tax=Metapseudomonas furukawaii TaxID=1149133 RepID=A0AAD1C275_METFU|nr:MULTISPECIES: ATP-binding protein [Pseudomonas]ELS27806.1 Sensor protein PhoQ [Pseudomonas furukawaii]OWJ90166.1 two-component sensor histidine kinase [Pseudomonas sp. A46]BAU75405.1 sensor protein PhoQ [Pseudomonas furukawaii]
MSLGFKRLLRFLGASLRLRLMLGAAAMAALFMLALLPALRGAFVITLEQSIQQRLAADASALIAAARVEGGHLEMPDKLPNEEFDNLEASQLGYIFDSDGNLVWQSRSSRDEALHYRPRYDGQGHEFLRATDSGGHEYFVYDVEVDLLRGQKAAFSVVTMQPVSDYRTLYDSFMRQLYLGLGVALAVLLALLWFGLTWGFRSLRELSAELDQVEAGSRGRLSDDHPRELLRLTRSLNRLLDSERRQRERYRHSLDDLAHSLKTPLSVLQGVSETIAARPEDREQARVLQTQIERMSQQIGYQLQRASLRKSGLVRHQVPLAPLLDTLCDALDKVYREKRVRVERDFDPGLTLPMEQGAALEMLGNLLENAYRLSLGHIRVSGRAASGTCELRVEDDGPGVPVDQRERILKRGERLDAQHPGQGIGTAVVKDIIESYDGELFLDDSPLGGAEFRMRFPLP